MAISKSAPVRFHPFPKLCHACRMSGQRLKNDDSVLATLDFGAACEA